MFISDKIIAAFNKQIGQEYSNALQYTSVANWFAAEDLRLLAAVFYAQADEERAHAKRFSDFLLASGARVEIPALIAVQNGFANAVEAAQLVFDAEQRTTRQINELADLAETEKSHSAKQFLQWFIQEQVEEVATAATNLNLIKKASNNIFMVEAYLAHKG